MIFMKLFARIKTMYSGTSNSRNTDVKSIYDDSGELYDTLSIDCADNVEDVIDSVDSIDACEDMVDYYDEY